MKATGIVRRIDDLGRVVIPKEIRRTLRIREGDPPQTTLTPWLSFCVNIGRFAERQGLGSTYWRRIFQLLCIFGVSVKTATDYLFKNLSPSFWSFCNVCIFWFYDTEKCLFAIIQRGYQINITNWWGCIMNPSKPSNSFNKHPIYETLLQGS